MINPTPIQDTPAPRLTGLSHQEVEARIARGETNDYESRVGRTYWEIIRDNFFNLFNIVLSILLVIVFIFQDWGTLIAAGFSVFWNTLLGAVQEINAKRKLEQLAALAAKEAEVWRDGQLVTIPAREIVKDDMIALTPGAIILVDGVIVSCDSLEIDESQLTGESDPIYKEVNDAVTSGSFCLAGSGLMKATAVGKQSAINQLTSLAKAYKRILTPTQTRVNNIVEFTIMVMFVLGIAILIAGFMQQKPIVDVSRDLVVLLTSLVPQGLVLVSTLSLTVGAILISRQKTLIQRVNAVESVSSASVLCFDKTGTLTRNELQVQQVIPLNGTSEQSIIALLHKYSASLASQNTTAQAISAYQSAHPLANNSTIHTEKQQEIAFTSARKWGAVVFGDETLVLGAADRLLADDEHLPMIDDYVEMGMRVLAFGRADGALNAGQLTPPIIPLALIILSDQIRDDIQETLHAFQDLSVSLKILSGDHLKTVKSIAEQAGMSIDHAYTGETIDSMSDSELDSIVKEAQLFARISPEGKQRVIKALQKQGEYVAMVGDGVNDVPALKAANLAVVMNNGAQIAKDVADIILLNNAMTTLPLAFSKGKEITQTVYATAKLFLAKNMFATLLIVLVGMMMLPFPISPVQMSIVTLFTANLHAALYPFGVIKPKLMTEFRRDVLDYVVSSGILGAIHMAVLYFVTYVVSGFNIDAARSALMFYALLYGLIVFWNTQGVELTRPRTLITYKWSVILAGLFAGIGLIVPYIIPDILRFYPPTLEIILLIVALYLLNVVLLEVSMYQRHLLNVVWKIVEP